ncbi:hypothetical protein HID58_023205, partial [Brassica napus]
EPETTHSTPSPPQTPSTQVNLNLESINREFEISSDTVQPHHRDRSFAQPNTVNRGRVSIPHLRDLHPPNQARTTDDVRAEEASTSRGQEPASTKLKKPPPPGDKPKKPNEKPHQAFLTTTAPLRQRHIRHGRPCSRAQARRLEEKTKPKHKSTALLVVRGLR